MSPVPGAKVEVTLEIKAEAPDGVQRIVNENCQTLKSGSHEFSEE